MDSFIKYIPESFSDNKAFVEHMLSIIDTKLQFVKHQTNELIASYSTSAIYQSSDSPFIEDISSELLNTPLESEKVFSRIEHYSKTTNLLLQLRTNLSQKNVSLIYDLLCNDRFMEFESKALEKLLKVQF